MRLAVISDIHGECFVLDQVLQDIRSQGIEQIVCLGDALQEGANPDFLGSQDYRRFVNVVGLSGAARLAVYSAVKAFNVNFAEGLWAELHPLGVDVCCTPLGQTWTEALQRMGVTYDPAQIMLSDDAAREIIDNIGNGPTYIVGERNRAMVSQVWTIDRRTLVEMISAASADFATQRATGQ